MSGADSKIKVLVIAGPTGVGKSALGMELARRHSGEIVSADSMQIYQGLDLGTAKPTLEERREIPHHLVDIVPFDEPFTVADYQVRARRAIAEIAAHGHLPLLVGGTGLYIKATLEVLELAPKVPDEVRRQLERRAEREGLAALFQELQQRDPQAAARLAPTDKKRILRALEVLEFTGKPWSSYQAGAFDRPLGTLYNAAKVGLRVSREELYRRLDARVDAMLEAGLLEEVRRLKAAGATRQHQSMQALGYKQLLAYLEGEFSLAEAIRLIKRDTRRFAKRQFTWFRADKRLRWLDLEEFSTLGELAEAAWQVVQAEWRRGRESHSREGP